jgi:hypothetical protein
MPDMLNVSTVINFCSNDFRFLKACCEGARGFSQQIIITVCDHLFDGTEENYALLEHAFRMCPDVLFIEYPFDAKESYWRFSPYFPEHPYWRHDWHNTGRWIAFYFLPESCDYILFLDVDEIVDGPRFAEWLKQADVGSYSALRLAAHWYFREARYCARTCDDISLLVKKQALHPEYLWSTDERTGIFDAVRGKKEKGVKDRIARPFVDHYSWVRTQEELKKKFTAWGHYWERPWLDLLEKEYAGAFQGKDFVRHYDYEETVPRFDPLAVPIPELSPISLEQHRANLSAFPHVMRVDKKQMQRKELLDLVVNDRCL